MGNLGSIRESQRVERENRAAKGSMVHAGIKSCLPRRLHGLTLEARAAGTSAAFVIGKHRKAPESADEAES
jgi:hypothetical protein